MSKIKEVETELTGAQLGALLNRTCHLLDADVKADLYKRMCKIVGVNPAMIPFNFVKTSDKKWKEKDRKDEFSEVLYPNKALSAHLKSTHKISAYKVDRDISEKEVIFTVYLRDPANTEGIGVGVCSLSSTYDGRTTPLTGERRANKIMHAYTKAERRGILNFCGFGFLDETELDTMELAADEPAPEPAGERVANRADAFRAARQGEPAPEPKPAPEPAAMAAQAAPESKPAPEPAAPEAEPQKAAQGPASKANKSIGDPETEALLFAMEEEIRDGLGYAESFEDVEQTINGVFAKYAQTIRGFSNKQQGVVRSWAVQHRTEKLEAAQKDFARAANADPFQQ